MLSPIERPLESGTALPTRRALALLRNVRWPRAKRSVATHPVFRSSGCGTDPHQSPIGFKASADVLASAPGSRRAPENPRYQANVQGLRKQCGYPFGYQACLGSWSGRFSRYAASGMAGDASQSTCWFDANKAAGLVIPRQGQPKHRSRSKGLPSRIM